MQRDRIRCALLSCMSICLGCSPNHSYFSKANVRLSGTISNGSARYEVVTIGTADRPFFEDLDVYKNVGVNLDGDKVVRLEELTVQMLLDISDDVKDLDNLDYDSGWPKGSKQLAVGDCLFFVVNEKAILHFYATVVGGCVMTPCFYSPGTNDQHCMPLSVEEVKAVFGDPDRIVNKWHS